MLALLLAALIRGSVTSGGAPLPGATIAAGGRLTISDTNGRFSLPIAPGHYTMTASFAGMHDATQTIEVRDDDTRDVQLALVPVPGAAFTVTCAFATYAPPPAHELAPHAQR
jgi:Carboxypeptidase regulatory-like domain